MSPANQVFQDKEMTRRNYNGLSRWYDLLSAGSETQYCELGLEMLALNDGETVLEIGFGTGRSLISLAKQVGPSGRVMGIDLSDGMAEVARARIKQCGCCEMIDLAVGDGCDLPVVADRLNAVFLSFTLELFNEREIPLVLGECWRVLQPGGRLGIVSLSLPDQPGWPVRVYNWLHGRYPSAIDCRPITANVYLSQAGFNAIKNITKMMWGLPVDILVAKKSVIKS